jgi:hypothetical protein
MGIRPSYGTCPPDMQLGQVVAAAHRAFLASNPEFLTHGLLSKIEQVLNFPNSPAFFEAIPEASGVTPECVVQDSTHQEIAAA